MSSELARSKENKSMQSHLSRYHDNVDEKLNMKKVMFATKTTIELEMMEHIRHAIIPKEAWNFLAQQFSKKNDARF